MDLPALKVINQGGGRMPDELFRRLAGYANDTGRRFYATYGATETTSRMSCLKPEFTSEKYGSIGTPISDYKMWLVDENGENIDTSNTSGELVFEGGNVTMGYADCLEDLAKGDERKGIYKTGDIAYRDEDGFYYIVGRTSRFLKIFGYRVNLDETERLIKSEFDGEFACAGRDNELNIFTINHDIKDSAIRVFLKDRLKLNITAFKVVYLDEIPKKKNGKTDYMRLEKNFKNERD
jgi:acyl-CoA synthetase (AMP-forming)/AMP-acid ligase II